jgi:hypothetical protein
LQFESTSLLQTSAIFVGDRVLFGSCFLRLVTREFQWSYGTSNVYIYIVSNGSTIYLYYPFGDTIQWSYYIYIYFDLTVYSNIVSPKG